MLSRLLLLAAANTEAAAWSPEQISTELWLDFSDSGTIAKSGTDITLVTDKSGNFRTFAPGSSRPKHGTQTVNGLPVAVFTGAEFLQSQQPASTWRFLNDSTGSTCFYVNNSYSGYLLASGDASDSGIIFITDQDSVALFILANSSIAVLNEAAFSPTEVQLISAISNPSATPVANRSILQVNAGTEATINSQTTAPASEDPNTTLYLGGIAGTASGSGSIAEVIIISGIAPLSDRQKAEGYLAHKWGLTASLPANHPYKSVAP